MVGLLSFNSILIVFAPEVKGATHPYMGDLLTLFTYSWVMQVGAERMHGFKKNTLLLGCTLKKKFIYRIIFT